MTYLYCPIGDKIADYLDNLDNIRYTYPDHGYGKIDWMIDGGNPVYSMTSGTITKVSRVHDEYPGQNQKGYYVYVQPSGIGRTDILIRYLEMGGLAQTIVDQLTKESLLNAGGTATYSTDDPADAENCSIPISQGDLIGYTNGFRADHQSSLHIDFTDLNSSPLSVASNAPQISESNLANGFTIENGKIYQNGAIIGTSNGKVPRQGSADSAYDVWPYYSYCIQLQKPQAYSSAKGGSCANVPQEFFSTTLEQEYICKNSSYSYDRMLDMIAALCVREMGYSSDGDEASLSGFCVYAKLIRARSINDSKGLYHVLQSGGFTGFANQTLSSVNGGGIPDATILAAVKECYCTSSYNNILSQYQSIAASAPYFNYGYSGLGYPTNTSSIEAELTEKINNKSIVSHITLGNSKLLVGCIGNTGLFANNNWI